MSVRCVVPARPHWPMGFHVTGRSVASPHIQMYGINDCNVTKGGGLQRSKVLRFC
jgi:hypothetical protein